MNTMVEAVRETATATTRAIDRLRERNGDRNGGRNGERGGDGNDNESAGNHDNPMTLATFLKVNPPKFKGTLVATEADNWFRDIEKSLRAQHVPERQYVEFATYMLEGEAEHWWHGVQRLLRQMVEEIDWDTFKEEFYKKYFPRTVRDAKEMELMQLTQGNMSVEEYTRKFEDLCRFSKICQGNPLVPLEIRNFAELVNKSQLMEDYEYKMAASRMGHPSLPPRNFNNFHRHTVQRKVDFKVPGVPMRGNQQVRNFPTHSTTGNGNRPRQDTGKQPQQQSQKGPTCRQCGKNHPGRPCYLGLRVCYYCGEPGHIASNCPEKLVQGIAKLQQPGRVFTVIAEDARTQTP
ncbi:uncharacterized protein LOC130975703 [Arachis stenosperma]|uniref:uncharacterized protein LOC130975703 n=1 Tax=Arachis stenosperma TaxID=217475 RepID=UPI0025AD0C0B|nr:uncharacterized protein LOC130975703 [Arachis stenosperma]